MQHLRSTKPHLRVWHLLVPFALVAILSSTFLALSGASFHSTVAGTAAAARLASSVTANPVTTTTKPPNLSLLAEHHKRRREVIHMIHARHSHRRWLIARHHAARVRNAKLRRHPHTFGADWYSTDTADWRCIRTLEEGMAQAPANEFGFVPYYGGMSHAQQSALALSILHNYGWGAWSTAPACGL